MEIVELGEDIIDIFKLRVTELALPKDIKFLYQAVPSQKLLIKLSKIPDQYKFATGCDILVQINPDYFDTFNKDDSKIIEILFDQVIDNISFNSDKGTFKLNKPTFKTNCGIIDKYSYDEVARAVEAERLYLEQLNDKDKESKENNKSKNNKSKYV